MRVTTPTFHVTLIVTLSLLTSLGVTPLRIRTHSGEEDLQDEDGSDGIITASPTLIYRRRLNSDRSFQPSIYPPPSAPSNSIEEIKTESDPDQGGHLQPYQNPSEDDPSTYSRYPPSSFPTTTRKTTRRRPHHKKLKSVRRNRSRIRTVTLPQEPAEPSPQQASSIEQEQYTPKPISTKPKSGRRRKVKRPNKNKIVVTRNKEEGGSEDEKLTAVNNSTTSGGGDKNLALEIGSQDGKYALIDKFFDDKPSQAPGLVSYKASDDFPKNDNKQTLGNVKANDIWLSDGHLLVLKGGDLDASLREHWKPIDNYQRGNRPPLRIALDSNNPPPFPVFVNDTGPPVFLGPLPPFGLPYPPPGAFNESFDPSRLPPPGMVPLYPNGSIPEYFAPPLPFRGGNNSLFPQGAPPGGQYGGGGYGPGNFNPNNNGQPPPYPFFPPQGNFTNNQLPPPPHFFPFPPPGNNRNGSFPPGPPPPGFYPPPPGFNRTGGPPGPGPGGYPPFFPPLVLNPNDNETDDPSIFLPPPYDFDYQDDNTTIVPPGPFAPGLVVPPPKNFYTVYNKTPTTTTRPTFPPATGLYNSFGNKRPQQRPNGKKPKFPMTNPPDDSEEAYQPLVTTPFPYVHHNSEAALNNNVNNVNNKKRKYTRPGAALLGGAGTKLNKGNFNVGSKYEADTDVSNVISPPPITPLSQDDELDDHQFNNIQSPSPPPPQPLPVVPPLITNTIAPIVTNLIVTTPKPLNNYVYVRGQLKSLAELNQEALNQHNQQQQQGDLYSPYEPTPRPPFDERGYPTRVLDDEDHVILQYNKKPTELPVKSVYYNTPKYDAIYNMYTKKPTSKKIQNHQYFINNNNDRPSHTVRPIVLDQQSPPIYLNNQNNNNHHNGLSNLRHHQNNQNNVVYQSDDNNGFQHPNNNYYTPLGGTGGQRQKPTIIQLQSPKYSLTPTIATNLNNADTNSRRQPHAYNHNSGANSLPQVNNFATGFRPAFGPTVQPQSNNKPNLIYPSNQSVRQRGPIFDFQNQYFNPQQPQPRPQVDGYYSPITQYYQPLQQSQPQQNNYFPNSQQFRNNFNNQNNNLAYQQPQQQTFQPFFNQQENLNGGQSLLNPDQYRSPLLSQQFPQQEQQQSPLRQDLYVNYRCV